VLPPGSDWSYTNIRDLKSLQWHILNEICVWAWLRNKHNQLDTHFTFTYTLLRIEVSTCFGHYLSIFRRHCMMTHSTKTLHPLHMSRFLALHVTGCQNWYDIVVLWTQEMLCGVLVIKFKLARFEALTAVLLSAQVFWNVCCVDCQQLLTFQSVIISSSGSNSSRLLGPVTFWCQKEIGCGLEDIKQPLFTATSLGYAVRSDRWWCSRLGHRAARHTLYKMLIKISQSSLSQTESHIRSQLLHLYDMSM
jgi:hypothetical protein